MTNKKDITVFIGYDSRQDLAYRTCAYSIRKHSGPSVPIYPLDHKELRRSAFFDRPWTIEEQTGRFKDVRDGKNFSTEFSHTRFLTPSFAQHLGVKGYAVFVDSDFVFITAIQNVLDDIDPYAAVSVVKHDYRPENDVKMDGQEQATYNKKLWSSFMVFNLDHPMAYPKDVNLETGRNLHQFNWLREGDIGSLPEKWNFIPGHSQGPVSAVHFTEGTPLMSGYETVEYADLFNKYYLEMINEVLVRRHVDGQR